MTRSVECAPFFGRVGNVINDKYVIERIMGHGAYGTVYKVRANGHNEPMALKVIRLWDADPVRRNRILSRLDMDYQSALIQSEYLVGVHDKGLVNGNPYIVTDFCARGNINEAIGTPEFDLTTTALQVLFGLRSLHASGKVHGDLKPQNVLLQNDGSIRLSDFGVVSSCNRSLANRGLYNTDHERFMTYAYMAPETLSGKDAMSAVLPTADIFAFGVMMYETLTGYLPFGPLTEPAELQPYLERLMSGDWDRRKLSYSPNLRCWLALIEGCLCTDPRQRLQSIDAVLELMPLEREARPATQAPEINEARNGHCLRVLQGEQFGHVFYLDRMIADSGRNVITIGRNDVESSNFVSIRERQSCFVSRRQCTLEQDPDTGRWLLRDGQWDVKAPGRWRSSRNGTLVGTEKVDSVGRLLEIGDIITLGDVKLRLEGY